MFSPKPYPLHQSGAHFLIFGFSGLAAPRIDTEALILSEWARAGGVSYVVESRYLGERGWKLCTVSLGFDDREAHRIARDVVFADHPFLIKDCVDGIGPLRGKHPMSLSEAMQEDAERRDKIEACRALTAEMLERILTTSEGREGFCRLVSSVSNGGDC